MSWPPFHLCRVCLCTQEDSQRYQEEIISDMERRRNACKQLSRVWDRQRDLNMLTKQVSALY